MTESATQTTSEDEMRSALHDLAALVSRGVPGCDGASLTLLSDGGPSTAAATHDYVRAADQAQYDRDSGPCVSSMVNRQEVIVEDYAHEARWPGATDGISAAGVRSSLSLPLAHRGQLLGSLNLYALIPRAFAESSRSAAEAFARQAVMTLSYLHRLHTEREAHAQERNISAALQRSLLPTLPDLPGITCAARYHVGSRHAQVGGDWYDVFALPDGAIGIAVGDVMGHDLQAAAAMGQLRSVLRSYAYEGSSPSVVLDRLDRLVQDFQMAQVATAIYGRLTVDTDSAMLLFTNAGHPPPLLRAPDGQVSQLRRGAAPLIGAVPPGQVRRGEAAVVLPHCALLVLYTDGLIETREDDIDQSIHKLATALEAIDADASPEQVCDGLLTAMTHDNQDDDVALLVLRLDPPATTS